MNTVFIDIDTQVDFIMPDGALYVKDAEKLLPIYKEISSFARSGGIPVLASADAHAADDPEFKQFPPHCVKGQPGQKKVPETLPDLFFVQENDGRSVEPDQLRYDHILFEKQTFDVFSNPKIDAYLQHLKPERVVVYGVATDYCVKAAVESLLKKNLNVYLLTDAIKAVDPSSEKEILNNLEKNGARLTTFSEIKEQL